MGRNVEVRQTYQADALYLQRLIKAIEKDPRRTNEWKKTAVLNLKSVVSMLFETIAREG